jgi:hypothetical protein
MQHRAPTSTTPRAILLLPLAALLVLHPLLLHGPSCGQDQLFHIQSWLDAASQLRHGHYPTWAITPAFHAGEPRFLFYPPLSWLLGALLITLTSALHLPTSAALIAFDFIALTSAGLAFHRLARHFVSPSAALLSAALYLANPYMLYNALERSAYAELLAATWVPLLFLGLLRTRPTIRGVAIPLALLWLTNAPAAVMGSYTLAVIAILRIASCLCLSFFHSEHREEPASRAQRLQRTSALAEPSDTKPPPTIGYPEASASGLISPQKKLGFSPWGMPSLALAKTFLYGAALGLALPAFYLLPAAHQRRFVQVAMAIIPNLRFQDNFLFTATSDAPHNAVNRTVSYLALTLLAATALTLSAYFLKSRARKDVVILSEGSRGTMRDPQPKDPESLGLAHTDSIFSTTNPKALAPILALLTLLIAFLLVPISTPIWLHLPELAFLQFPWRLLTILSAVLALALALLLNHPTARLRPSVLITLTLVLPLALGILGYRLYAQACDPADLPSTAAALFAAGHGVPPTDEYTPIGADNDVLRSNNPAFWLLPDTVSPDNPAPNTTPTPSELNPAISTDDIPLPASQTLSATPPPTFTIHPSRPSILVLNLRGYPNWSLTRSIPGEPLPVTMRPLLRDDGLIAVPVEAGPSTITITWQRSLDQNLGLTISLIALFLLALTFRRTPSSNSAWSNLTPQIPQSSSLNRKAFPLRSDLSALQIPAPPPLT